MRLRSTTAALAALTLLAGCGSSSTSDPQLRSQATAICARANHLIGGIATPANASGGGQFLSRGIAALKPELRQLQQLSSPDDSADVWRTAIRSLSAQLAALESTAAKIDAGGDPVAAYKSLQQTLAPLESQANGAWEALQIPACENQ